MVTHTAEGDMHDIGQVIVHALLSANGFAVINMGADVPVDTVVSTCVKHQPLMVTGTALMTTTMSAFSRVAEKLKDAGLDIPFVCGGGAVNEEYVTSLEFGIWGKEASQARTRIVNKIKHMLRRHNLHWEMPTKTFPTQRAIAWLEQLALPVILGLCANGDRAIEVSAMLPWR